MDRYGIIFWVQHDDLQQASGGVSANHQHSVLGLAHHAERDRDRGKDVVVGDPVPPS